MLSKSTACQPYAVVLDLDLSCVVQVGIQAHFSPLGLEMLCGTAGLGWCTALHLPGVMAGMPWKILIQGLGCTLLKVIVDRLSYTGVASFTSLPEPQNTMGTVIYGLNR